MSADNYKMSNEVQAIIDFEKAWHIISNDFQRYLNNTYSDFRGVSVVIASSGGYLFIAKRFSDDGTPEILFANGESPMEALRRGVKSIENGDWKVDKSPNGKGRT